MMRRQSKDRTRGPAARCAVVVAAAACLLWTCAGSEAGGREPVRLVDHFDPASVAGTAGDAGSPPRTEWVFGAPELAAGTGGWKALAGVAGLRVAGGALVGRSEAPVPILGLEWSPAPEQRDDSIHSIEVRLRASGGGRVAAGLSNAEQIFLPPLMAPGNPFAFPLTSPIVPGDDAQLYSLRPVTPMRAAAVRRLLLKPVDAPGVEFAIESVRLVFEREHLASVPAGLSWQGLGGLFRETLVARSPEELRFDVTLPRDPVFDLAVGTLAPGAVTFEVRVSTGGGAGAGDLRSLRRTVTTSHRWDDVRLDLAGLAGKPARISLRIDAAEPGAIGLWGSPVVRSRVAPDRRNDRPQGVIVVLIDTLRSDHLAPWGYQRETAPLLSRLASEGVVAEDAIAQAAWTKVSVPSILTSLYPTSHTVKEIPDLLPASAITMAEVFREAGYATFGFSAIPFTGKMTNLHQGYEQFQETRLDVSTGGTVEDKAARGFVDRLLPWLERHRDLPFFAVLHVEDPHSPYFAPPPFARRWADAAAPERYREMQQKVQPVIANPLMRQFIMPTRDNLVEVGVDPEQYVRYEHDAYDALIEATDAEIARVIERLETLGLADRVVLAFTSDHGTEFLDHDQHFHGHSVYGELNRVPMFFWGPSFVPAGVRIPATVQNLDFMPTVLELAGLPVPEAAQGQSLLPWFGAGGQESVAAANGWRRKPAITEKPYVAAREPGGYASYSIISGGWKLIHNVEPPPDVLEFELYDHAADPINVTNLADEHPDKVKAL
ncbi:MAG TPA: sulfatase, partial [Thermoanaerobaculia bacterium]|nr:sulfatase [Thermoanaerobaculia bacterium]